MKVVVTGANGQLGRALIASKPLAVECVGVVRTMCDLSVEAEVKAFLQKERPDIIINSGAYTAVDLAETDARAATLVNADSVGVMRAELQKTGGQLIQISTDFVFDGSSAKAYIPSDRPNPISVYGHTKAAGEVSAGPEALIVRTSGVYAAGGKNFVRTMLQLMRERDELRVVNDQISAPTWATGLAEVIWSLSRLKAKGVFHHRDAGVASWYDFALAIQEEAIGLGMLNRAVPVVPISTDQYPTPAKRPAFSLLNDVDTRRLLGDKCQHWRVNLRKMLKEEREIV